MHVNMWGNAMDFDRAWQYLQRNQPLHLETSGGTPFRAYVTDDSIAYKSERDQRRPQSKENFRQYFRTWFEEGQRESRYFPNAGPKKSPSARYRYFSAVFRHLEGAM